MFLSLSLHSWLLDSLERPWVWFSFNEAEKVENLRIFKWKENIFLQSLQGMVNDATYSNQTESGRNWQELDDEGKQTFKFLTASPLHT